MVLVVEAKAKAVSPYDDSLGAQIARCRSAGCDPDSTFLRPSTRWTSTVGQHSCTRHGCRSRRSYPNLPSLQRRQLGASLDKQRRALYSSRSPKKTFIASRCVKVSSRPCDTFHSVLLPLSPPIRTLRTFNPAQPGMKHPLISQWMDLGSTRRPAYLNLAIQRVRDMSRSQIMATSGCAWDCRQRTISCFILQGFSSG